MCCILTSFNLTNLIGESLNLHRSWRHLVVLFRQKLRDQSLDVEEQNVPVSVLRVGPESVDHKRERSTLLLNLLFNINLGFKL